MGVGASLNTSYFIYVIKHFFVDSLKAPVNSVFFC